VFQPDFEFMANAPFMEGADVGWTGCFSLEIPKRFRNCRFSSRNRAHSAKASASFCSMGIEAFNANRMSEHEWSRDANCIQVVRGKQPEFEPQRVLRLDCMARSRRQGCSLPMPWRLHLDRARFAGEETAHKKARLECAYLVEKFTGIPPA
jgi:hypothetical protein